MIRTVTVAAVGAMAILAFLYRGPGDSTLVGEILTVWPPELWACAAIVVISKSAISRFSVRQSQPG